VRRAERLSFCYENMPPGLAYVGTPFRGTLARVKPSFVRHPLKHILWPCLPDCGPLGKFQVPKAIVRSIASATKALSMPGSRRLSAFSVILSLDAKSIPG